MSLPLLRNLALGSLLVLGTHRGFAAEPLELLKNHVEFLASEELEGRLTGSEGERLAAEYIEDRLKSYGLSPLPGQDSFVVKFLYTAGMEDTGSSAQLFSKGSDTVPAFEWVRENEMHALPFSSSGTVTAPVVFAGYGIQTPEDPEFSYDSYVGLDVKDKIVLVLRYFPEDADEGIRSKLARYSGLRYKAMHARDKGAAGIIIVGGPRSPHAGELVSMSMESAGGTSDILAASINGSAADELFTFTDGKKLVDVQKELDTGNPHVSGFEIPGLTLTLNISIERQEQEGRNVIGYLPPSPDAANPKPGEYVMACAHYDHLGRGGGSNSLARSGEADQIHYGADDNASGSAAVLAIAQRMATMKRDRPLIAAFWSGEEMGLLGSADFVKTPPVPIEQLAAVINLDMVGRMKDEQLVVQSMGSSSVWPSIVEQANVPVGFDLKLQDDPYLPTDSTSFYQAKVPALTLFTDVHEDYHRPTDTADKIRYTDLERVAHFGSLIAYKLCNLPERPDYKQVDRSWEPSQRDSLRAYTGTIPDYTTEVEGLRLSGVAGGGPAEKAGLLGGDVIVEMGGRKIANIYDYTYALDVVKIGEPVKVVYMRDGKKVEATMIPESR